MRSLYLVPIAALFFLAACNDVRKPNDLNFTKAIDQYLTNHDEACTMIDHQFTIDVPQTEPSTKRISSDSRTGSVRGAASTMRWTRSTRHCRRER
jgi:hypothetical protein